MCGRYYIDEESNQELLKIIRNLDQRLQGVPTQPGKKERRIKTGEIFPSDTVPIISQGKESARYDAATWGYTVADKSSLIINARSESAQEKPLFSHSFKSNRVVIPASGFFEWTHDTNKKKYYFTSPEDPMLYMAGISRTHDNNQNFVILTTQANESMEDIHNRMPVLLYKEEIPDYLSSMERAEYYIHRKSPLLKRELMLKNDTLEKKVVAYQQLQLPLD